MKKLLLVSLSLFVFSVFLGATDFQGTKYAAYFVMPNSGSSYYAWGSVNIGRFYDSGSAHIIARTQFTFDLSTIPTNATINSVSLSYSCSGMGNYYQFKIKEVQNNSSPQTIYSSIYNGTTLFDNIVYNSSSLSSQALTTLVSNKKGTYLYLGAMSNNEVSEDSYSYLDLTLSISYSIPPSNVSMYLDNNFISAGGTNHGTMIIDGQNTTIPLTKLSISRLTQSTLNLSAVSLQNDNQSHQMIWHTGTTAYSEWKKDGVPKSPNQNYSFTVQSDDNGVTYLANLRKNFRIDQTHITEFDGDQTQQNTSWIVEQNNGSITAPSSKTVGSNNYNFAGWIDNLTLSQTRSINSPTDNQTYTALYKYPHHSNTGVFANSGQRKVIKCDYGYLHLVYESMGYVWYERSTDNGASWHIMNGGKPIDKNPSKSPSIDFYYGYQRLIIVYQTWAGDNNEFAAIKAACFANGQLQFTTTVYESYLSIYPEVNYKPAVGYASNDNIAVAWEDYGVWVLTGVLSFSTNQVIWNNIIGVDNYNYDNINPTIAAYKTTPGIATFHLAWQNNYSTIRYCNLTAQSDHTFLVSAVDQVSQGCGFPVNYYPSINVSNSNDVQLVWIGTPYYGSSYRKVLSRSRTTNWSSSFAQYGNNVLSPDVAFYTGASVVSWSENPFSGNTFTNKFIKYGSVKTAGTTGKDVRIFNASSLQDMHLVSFTTNSLPYAFTHSANLNSINKDNSLVMASGVQAVAFKDEVEYFFRIGDISFNGSNIDFESFEDTVGILSFEDLNTNLITNSFTTNETNILVYSIEYGVTDSVLALVHLQNEFISFKVELIDQITGVLLAELNNIQMDENNVEKLKTNTFSFNITGLPSSSLAIRLKVNNDLEPEYAAAIIKSDEGVLLKTNTIELNLSGTGVITDYSLGQNYPNPFNPSTKISWQSPVASYQTLKVYDILGNEVATLVDEFREAGKYEVQFDVAHESLRAMASGVYIYKLQAGDFISSKKMLLLK